MASTKSFLPRVSNYSAATAAGSGAVVRWTYTVPAGHRALVGHLYVKINANTAAAGTIQAAIFATIAGTTIELLTDATAGLGNNDSKSYAPTWLDLDEGDTLSGVSTNNSIVAVTMILNAVVREYQ